MAGYQILGIRSYFDVRERKQKRFDAFFEQRWRFDDIAEIFRDPIAILDKNKIAPEERYNLYYTISFCGDAKRQFQSLEIIPFDIDGIDVSRTDEYVREILALLHAPNATVVFSGNGLHFILRNSEPFTTKEEHEERRSQYRAILNKINLLLEKLRLPGKADPAVWDVARILRFPETINRKPDKQNPEKEIDKRCYVLHPGDMVARPFDWDKISEAKRLDASEAIPAKQLRRYARHDGEEAMDKCLFLRHAKESPNAIDEPEWYAVASIVGRFDKGRELFHEISKGHRGYTPGATDEKLEQALAASGPRTCKNINNLWGKCSACPLFEKITSPVVIMADTVIATEATGFYNVILTKDGDEKLTPNYNDLLKAYRREHPYKTISDMRTVYRFLETHYVDTNPIEIKHFSEQKFFPQPMDKMRNEFLSKVLANEVARKSFFSLNTENKINFGNGILDLSSGELVPHSPEFGFRAVLPYEFNAAAKCSKFDWWIRDIMLGDEDLVKVLQEFMGYVVRGGEYRWHKALWLSGSGRNGKSTFIDILKALIGNDNYATLSIKQIISDKFASSMLDGKIANFSEETSPEELSDSGPFKNLTGDGEINAQKKYGDPYQFRNRAKLIMSYNEVPMLKDLSPGMLSRPIIIPFKKDLTAKGAQDKSLKDQLLAELPGIFNFALAGWRRLEQQGDFTQSVKSDFEMQEIREASCTAAQWFKENVELLPGEDARAIKSRALYDAYKAEVGTYAYAEQKFYRRIAAIPEAALRRRRTETGIEYTALRLRGSAPTGEY